MSNVNQLLAKALSTTSEEEAMACLRMARKKGKSLDAGGSTEYNGHDAKYWYEKAAVYYSKAKEKQDGLSQAQQQQLWNMYKTECDSVSRLRQEKYALEKQITKLKADQANGSWKFGVIALQAVIILALVQFIG